MEKGARQMRTADVGLKDGTHPEAQMSVCGHASSRGSWILLLSFYKLYSEESNCQKGRNLREMHMITKREREEKGEEAHFRPLKPRPTRAFRAPAQAAITLSSEH